MQIKREQLAPTTVKLVIIADQTAIDSIKQTVVNKLSQNVKVPGFRPGKAPANLIEKQVDQAQLQAEFLDQAVNQFYVHAVQEQKLRPVAQPEISVTKFVPYTTLEFTAEVETVGAIKLGNYRAIKLAFKDPIVEAAEVTTVVNNLRQRAASRKPITRAAKKGDEVVIDFKGTDAKTKDAIEGADGVNYSLVLGSQSFIAGFEDELRGLKPGDQKTFTLKFPKDYGATALQNRPVVFDVTVNSVNELAEPKADDDFAASVGPFKTLTELKADIKKQILAEKTNEAQRLFDNQLLEKIAAVSEVAIPEALINEEIDRIEEEEKRNIVYRGQTWQEHLDAEGISAEAHHEKQRPTAELRVKAGLILGEIAEQENITVSPEELEMRITLLKGQYPDDSMQAELDKPENRRDILSRMLSEKTLERLRTITSK